MNLPEKIHVQSVKEIGPTLKKTRESKNITMELAAKHLQVGPLTLFRLESGSGSSTLLLASRYAHYLNVSLYWMLGTDHE